MLLFNRWWFLSDKTVYTTQEYFFVFSNCIVYRWLCILYSSRFLFSFLPFQFEATPLLWMSGIEHQGGGETEAVSLLVVITSVMMIVGTVTLQCEQGFMTDISKAVFLQRIKIGRHQIWSNYFSEHQLRKWSVLLTNNIF